MQRLSDFSHCNTTSKQEKLYLNPEVKEQWGIQISDDATQLPPGSRKEVNCFYNYKVPSKKTVEMRSVKYCLFTFSTLRIFQSPVYGFKCHVFFEIDTAPQNVPEIVCHY